MTTKAQGIQRAAVVRSLVNGLEKRIKEGIVRAEEAGQGAIADDLRAALACFTEGHGQLTTAAAKMAAHYGEGDVTVFSGGDKPVAP